MNARRSNHVRVNMKSVLETAFSRTKDLPPEKSSLEHVYRCGVGRLSARCRFFLFFGHFPWPAPAADGAIAHTVATAHSVSGHTPKRLPSHVVPTAYGTSPQKGHPADRTHDDPSHRHREGRHVVDGAHDVLQKSSTRGRMPGYFSPITWPGLRNRGGSAERVG